MNHVASPLSRGLFRAAISESGPPAAASPGFARSRTAAWAHKARCATSACLRAASMERLITAADEGNEVATGGWSPVWGTPDLPEHPEVLFRRNEAADVPLLGGFNSNEGTLFVWPGFSRGMNQSSFEGFAKQILRNLDPYTALNRSQFARVLSLYNYTSPDGDWRDTASDLFGDFVFICPVTRNMGLARETAFVYRFNHRTQSDLDPSPGVYHSMELPYVFGTPATYGWNFTTAERELSLRMQAMWTHFAKTLQPATRESFPEFGNRTQSHLVLQTSGDVVEQGFRAKYCDLWRELFLETSVRKGGD